MIQHYALSAESVDSAAQAIVDFLNALNLDAKLVLKYRLSVEETLNCWLKRQVGDQFALKMGKRLGRTYISLEVAGLPVNPYLQDEDDSGFINAILVTLNNAPQYSYRKGKNVIRFDIPKKQMNQLFQMLLSIGLGAVVGTILRLVLPDALCQGLLNEFIDPLYSAAFRMLGAISGPLILLSVTWGIYGIGDSATLSKVGRRLILSFVGVTFLIAIVAGVAFPLFRLNFNQTLTTESPLGTIFAMILDVIPSNIVQPFSDGNTLQIIFIAVVFGIAMLFLGKRVDTVADIVDQINCIVQFMMELISRIMPLFIFLIVTRLILNDTFLLMESIWILALIFVGALILLGVVITLVTSLRCHVSPVLLLKKSLPTFLIALTTSSSAACFNANMETCRQKFGIDESLSSFGVPLGTVMYKPAAPAYFMLFAFFFARQLNIECSVGWLATAVFMAAMLSIAAPPVPGSGAVVYAVFCARLGIPDDALAILLSIDVLIDFPRTAMSMYYLLLTLVNTASGLGLVDRDVLKKKTE